MARPVLVLFPDPGPILGQGQGAGWNVLFLPYICAKLIPR